MVFGCPGGLYLDRNLCIAENERNLFICWCLLFFWMIGWNMSILWCIYVVFIRVPFTVWALSPLSSNNAGTPRYSNVLFENCCGHSRSSQNSRQLCRIFKQVGSWKQRFHWFLHWNQAQLFHTHNLSEAQLLHECKMLQYCIQGKPLLLGGLKFDMRMYVFVAGGSMSLLFQTGHSMLKCHNYILNYILIQMKWDFTQVRARLTFNSVEKVLHASAPKHMFFGSSSSSFSALLSEFSYVLGLLWDKVWSCAPRGQGSLTQRGLKLWLLKPMQSVNCKVLIENKTVKLVCVT